MLVHLVDSTIFNLPVGIAVSEWNIDGHKRTFILYPFSTDTKYVQVDCAIEEDGNLEVVSAATKKWGSINNGYGEDSFGYPYSAQTADDLYKVWDDGAKVQENASQRLYSAFGDLIAHYTPHANKYLTEQHEAGLAQAKIMGWDSELAHQDLLTFPYQNH